LHERITTRISVLIMADYHREPVTDRRLQHAHSSFDSMEDFVEIIEHPMAKTTGHSGSGLGNQSKWFFRGPISLAPRNLVLNSPLKVRKTRENLRVMRPGNRVEKERDVPKLGVEKIPPQDIWSTPVPKLQGGASGILLASKLSVPANIETIGTGFPDTTVGDQNPQARLQRSQSLRQRVVTKVRKFSYKTKSVVSLSHALHGGPPSRQTSSESRHSLISEFEPDITSTPIKMEKLILGSDQQHSSLVSPPSIAFSSISPEFAGNGLFSTPPSPPDGTATNGLQVARRGPVQHSKVTLRAVLSIRPEVDCIDLNSDEAIWASVKIKGDALVMTASQHLGYPVPSLAVAVVIDNS
jgi:hypothetical protein